MLLKALRNGVGYTIVFLNWVTRPKQQERSEGDQKRAQQAVAGHALYQLVACPFCIKTRRAIRKLNVELDVRDIGQNKNFRQQLEAGGGRVMVPCLRIEEGTQVRWMYESADIIDYLQKRVAT